MIDIPVSFGELVDKLTILELKGHYIKDNNKSINIKYELQLLKKLYKEYYNTGDLPIKNHIYDLKGKLYEINSDLWKLEDNIRNKEKNYKNSMMILFFTPAIFIKLMIKEHT